LQASLDADAGTNSGDLKEMFNLCAGPLTADATLPPVRWPAGYPETGRAALLDYYRCVKRSTGHTHTHTDREQHPRHRHTHAHDNNNFPNPRTGWVGGWYVVACDL